jgi:hypothetical protein
MIRISKLKLVFFIIFAIAAVMSLTVPEPNEGEHASQEEVARIQAENGEQGKNSDLSFLSDDNLRSDQKCIPQNIVCRGFTTPCCTGLYCDIYSGFCLRK